MIRIWERRGKEIEDRDTEMQYEREKTKEREESKSYGQEKRDTEK